MLEGAQQASKMPVRLLPLFKDHSSQIAGKRQMGWGEDEGTEQGRAQLAGCFFFFFFFVSLNFVLIGCMFIFKGLLWVELSPPQDVLMS